MSKNINQLFNFNSKHQNFETYTHITSGIEFVRIYGKAYNMGLSKAEETAALKISNPLPFDPENLRPVHEVRINDFLISKTPVQNHQIPKSINWHFDNQDHYTPANVSLTDLQKILDVFKLSIPSEAQWEYMCRAGTHFLFPFGNELPDESDLEQWISCDFENLTKCKSNEWGIYGLFAGEWCSDFYKATHDTTSIDKHEKVLRGGASLFWPWQDEEWIWCMSSMRTHSEEGTEAAFRLVYEL